MSCLNTHFIFFVGICTNHRSESHDYVSTSSEFKPVKRRLKIDLVSYPAQAEGLVNSINKPVEICTYV